MKEDIWEKFERATANGYYKDIRWVEVRFLRSKGEDLLANGLVMQIRTDWELE